MNADEQRIYKIASKKYEGKYSVRYATPLEDCGYQKADIVIESNPVIYLQVSHTPKSKKEHKRLNRRGTYPIHTHHFQNMPLSDSQITNKLEEIIT